MKNQGRGLRYKFMSQVKQQQKKEAEQFHDKQNGWDHFEKKSQYHCVVWKQSPVLEVFTVNSIKDLFSFAELSVWFWQ